MRGMFTATAKVTIRAGAERVWDALVNPRLIRQYLFGTEAVSDWKEGSPVVYRGVWQGRAYEDKGTILESVPMKRLKSTYWSQLSGLADLPENYNTVTFELEPADGATALTVTQDNVPTKESAEHSARNWNQVLATMKELLER